MPILDVDVLDVDVFGVDVLDVDIALRSGGVDNVFRLCGRESRDADRGLLRS